ncbi:MAG: hypothetical protein BWX51_01419 [Bacteroidetes bacterium ADurb.Bin012]|jgi:hypothetical protein|nr:MAG: hypothetical protein BWX51_01419 [Bacteroidetes bacterium ADurb.Bin012]
MIPLLSLIGENNNEFANQIFYSHSISITPKIHLLFLGLSVLILMLSVSPNLYNCNSFFRHQKQSSVNNKFLKIPQNPLLCFLSFMYANGRKNFTIPRDIHNFK